MTKSSLESHVDSNFNEEEIRKRFHFFENNLFKTLFSKKLCEEPRTDEKAQGKAEDAPESGAESQGSQASERQCRICFGGEEEPLGKLVSPCKCKGTMKYVHVDCLDAWRNTFINNGIGSESSFFKCSNCLYEYHFSRARLAKLVTSTTARIILTLVILTLLIFCGGFCLKYLLLKANVTAQAVDQSSNFKAEDFLQLLELDRIDKGHLFLGIVFVGIVGFFVFFIQMILFGTLTVIGLRFPIFTYHRDTERIGIKERADSSNAAAILIAIVVIGLGHSFYMIYSTVSKCSKRWLDALGAHILEVDE